MTPESEQITNVVSVTTHMTPQAVAYSFKEWMGVLAMIYAALAAAVSHAFPVIQKFLDSRSGGILQATFYTFFGKPISASSQVLTTSSPVGMTGATPLRYEEPISIAIPAADQPKEKTNT